VELLACPGQVENKQRREQVQDRLNSPHYHCESQGKKKNGKPLQKMRRRQRRRESKKGKKTKGSLPPEEDL